VQNEKRVARNIVSGFARVYKVKGENINEKKELRGKLKKFRAEYMDLYADDLITRQELNDRLGSAALMNTPSTLGGNWQWRMLPGAATAELAAKLRRQMELYQRLPAPRS
jgi:4-alpha-glucanotransferase